MSAVPEPPPSLRRRALICFIGCGLSTLVVGALSLAASAPLLFPAFGASSFLVFNAPNSPFSSPRHILVGHAIGAGIGTVCAIMFGVVVHKPWLLTNEPWRAVASSVLALALSAPSMTLTRSSHPPAGATTLIFATGLMGGTSDFLAVLASCVALALVGHAVHRAAREVYPRWAPTAAK